MIINNSEGFHYKVDCFRKQIEISVASYGKYLKIKFYCQE